MTASAHHLHCSLHPVRRGRPFDLKDVTTTYEFGSSGVPAIISRRSGPPQFTHTTICGTLPHTKMKAIQHSKPGGPEVLEFVDIPAPTVTEGHVLIKNAYSGVNFVDMYPSPNPKLCA